MAIPLKAKLDQISSDNIRIQGPSKDTKLWPIASSLFCQEHIERVENVKSLGFYSCLFLVPKPHQGGGQ